MAVVNSLRCAVVSRAEGLLPLGSAGEYRGFLLVDWPLPWPSKLEQAPGIGPIAGALKGTGIRLQGVVPATGTDTRRVALYIRPAGDGFAGYRRVVRRTGPFPGLHDVVA